MRSRKKLLFVTDVFPHPLDLGQRVRVKNLLAACGRSFEVTFVGPSPSREEERRAVDAHCVRSVYLRPTSRRWSDRLRLAARTARTVRTIPRAVTVDRYQAYVEALSEARPRDYDLVWAERPHIARLFGDVQSRTILDLDDIEHLKIARRFRIERTAVARARSLYRYAFYRHLELSWSRRFLASVVCSEEDHAYMERHGCRNSIIVPNGPNFSRPWTSPPPVRVRDPGAPLRVVFLGNVGASPNADAIAFFADEVLPALRARIPLTTFDVLGPGASPAIASQYESRVAFRGFVPDLGAALAEYDVLVAPLRFGGGTKLKVLDAMAYGIPVVTTGIGAEGLWLRHGEHAWLSDTAASIADGVLRIKADPALADRLVANAYALVRDRFSWDSIQDRLSEWLLTLRPAR